MTLTVDDTNREERAGSISPLQGEAWALANESYHVPDGEPYLAAGRTLYQQDLHDRLTGLLARLDEQNERLDALLAEQRAEESAPLA